MGLGQWSGLAWGSWEHLGESWLGHCSKQNDGELGVEMWRVAGVPVFIWMGASLWSFSKNLLCTYRVETKTPVLMEFAA